MKAGVWQPISFTQMEGLILTVITTLQKMVDLDFYTKAGVSDPKVVRKLKMPSDLKLFWQTSI